MTEITIKKSYTDHDNKNPFWTKIFQHIESIKNEGDTKFIKNTILHFDLDIKSDSLKKKYKKWNENKIKKVNNTTKEHHRKLFTDKEEEEIYDDIINNYVNENKYLDDACVKIMAENKWKQTNHDPSNFTLSRGWVYYFKKKWKLSSLTAKYTRRSKKLKKSDIKNYHRRCKRRCKNIKPEYIFNFDETCWRTINGNVIVIGKTGSENRHLETGYNPKLSVTAGFLVSYANIFHKILLVLKGQTKRVLNKIATISDDLVYKKYTKSGWINVDLMIFVLEEIHKITNGEKSILILDQHSSHIHKRFKKRARELNIGLIYVPIGATATNQPLDVTVNGAMKMIGKKIIKEKYMSDPNPKNQFLHTVNALIEAKNKLNPVAIKKGFNNACNFKG